LDLSAAGEHRHYAGPRSWQRRREGGVAIARRPCGAARGRYGSEAEPVLGGFVRRRPVRPEQGARKGRDRGGVAAGGPNADGEADAGRRLAAHEPDLAAVDARPLAVAAAVWQGIDRGGTEDSGPDGKAARVSPGQTGSSAGAADGRSRGRRDRGPG